MISCFYLFNNCFRIGGKSLYLLNPKSQSLKKVMALVWLSTNISVIIELVVSQLCIYLIIQYKIYRKAISFLRKYKILKNYIVS